MSQPSLIALCRACAWAGAFVSCLAACRKDEPPPPLPEAPQVVEPAAQAPLELKPEDAGRPPPAPTPAKATTRKSSGGSVKACCAALRQNAVNAPEPNKGYMLYAAGICDMAATQGQDKASIAGAISSALKGVGLPSDCK